MPTLSNATHTTPFGGAMPQLGATMPAAIADLAMGALALLTAIGSSLFVVSLLANSAPGAMLVPF